MAASCWSGGGAARALGRGPRALAPERGTEQVERLAHHALRGEVWDKAVTYCQQAGARAYDRAAFCEAGPIRAGLQALAHLPEPGDTRGLALELRLALAARCASWESIGGSSPCWARPGPGRALDDRPGWDKCCPRWPDTQVTGDRRRHRDGPTGPRTRGCARDSALRYKPPFTWGRHTVSSRLRPGGPLRRTWRRRAGSSAGSVRTWGSNPGRGWHGPGQLGHSPRAGATGGGAPPRHAGRPRGDTDQCPRLSRRPVPHPGDLEHAIRVFDQGLARVVPLAPERVATIAVGLGYAYALQGPLQRGVRY